MPLIQLKTICRSILTAALAGLALYQPCHAESNNPYGAMNLGQFIQHVGQRLDLTIVFGDRVRTNKPILVYVDEELPKKKLFETFQTVLQLQDYIAIRHKGIVRIVRDREARSSPVPVLGPTSE